MEMTGRENKKTLDSVGDSGSDGKHELLRLINCKRSGEWPLDRTGI